MNFLFVWSLKIIFCLGQSYGSFFKLGQIEKIVSKHLKASLNFPTQLLIFAATCFLRLATALDFRSNFSVNPDYFQNPPPRVISIQDGHGHNVMTEFVGPMSISPKEQVDPKEAKQEGISSKYCPLKPIQNKNKESRKKWNNKVIWQIFFFFIEQNFFLSCTIWILNKFCYFFWDSCQVI